MTRGRPRLIRDCAPALAAAYEAGEPWAALCERFGLTRTQVWTALRNAGALPGGRRPGRVPARPAGVSPFVARYGDTPAARAALEALRDGLPLSAWQLAERLGYETTYLERTLRALRQRGLVCRRDDNRWSVV